MKVTIPLTFDSERDRDILAALNGEPNRSAAGRQALREHYQGAVSLADVLREIVALRREVQTLRRAGPPAAGPEGESEIDEPPDLAAALDSLGT